MALPINDSEGLSHAESRTASEAASHLFLINGGNFVDEPKTRIENGEVEVSGAHVNYTIEFSLGPISETAALFGPGKSGVERMYEPPRSALAEQGITSITIEPPHRQRNLKGFSPRHLLKPHRLLPISIGAVMKDASSKFDIPKFYLLGHSMGGPAAVSAAKRNPELTKAVVLPAPAGVEEHSFLDLVSRLPNHVPNEVLPYLLSLGWRDLGMLAIEQAVHTFSNPVRSITETYAVCRSRLLGRMGGLAVPSVIVLFQDDRLLRIDKAREALATYEGKYVEYPDPDAGHLLLQMKPNEFATFAIALLKVIDPDLQSGTTSRIVS